MNHPDTPYKIGAVIVLYNPDRKLLALCIQSIAPQVDEVCVIDNSATDNGPHLLPYENKVHYEPLGRNAGIAYAQNVGIRYFQNKAFDFVIFSDQDSTSPKSLVERLVAGYLQLSTKVNISCIGPIPVNRKTGRPYLYNACIIDKHSDGELPYYVMHSIISSYSLVPMTNFSEIGMMDERLFIDFVDQEWCWRAAGFNHKVCVMLPDVEIAHELGVSSHFLGLSISISSPFRIYYQTRNLLWLCRKPYVPAYWKKMNLKKIIIKFFYYSLIPKDSLSYCRRMLRGFADGISKRL